MIVICGDCFFSMIDVLDNLIIILRVAKSGFHKELNRTGGFIITLLIAWVSLVIGGY